MATVVIYADSTDRRVSSTSAVSYAIARAGEEGRAVFTSLQVGQDITAGPTQWFVWQTFLAFNTTGFVARTATLATYVSSVGGTPSAMECFVKDWGAAVGPEDFISGADLGTTYPVKADRASFTAGAYNEFAEIAGGLAAAINASGTTRLVLAPRNQRLNVEPTGLEQVSISNVATAGTTEDPKLTLTYVGTSPDNLLNPDLDQSNAGNWTTDTGATTALYAAIDENVASDTDFIQSPAGPSSSVYEVALEEYPAPDSSTGHIVRYRYGKSAAADVVDLTVALMQGGTEIASWVHTNITNTWTTAEQTLTTAQADSILAVQGGNYSDLRLRFTANTTSNATTPTKVADRATLNSNTAGTTFDHVLTGLTVGNLLIIRSAADNSGGGGAARSVTVTNQSGTAIDTAAMWTVQQNNDPGAASAGVTCNIVVAKITASSGTVRLTYSGSVVQASVAEEWSGLAISSPTVSAAANGVASTNLASLTDSSAAAKNLVYGVEAVEGPASDTYTQDADTTGGAWSDLTKAGTSLATADQNMTTYGGYKIPTATGAQTYNPTINVARDSAGLLLELAQGPATARAQVSWAQLEVPTSAPRTSPPPPLNIRRSFQALVAR